MPNPEKAMSALERLVSSPASSALRDMQHAVAEARTEVEREGLERGEIIRELDRLRDQLHRAETIVEGADDSARNAQAHLAGFH